MSSALWSAAGPACVRERARVQIPRPLPTCRGRDARSAGQSDGARPSGASPPGHEPAAPSGSAQIGGRSDARPARGTPSRRRAQPVARWVAVGRDPVSAAFDRVEGPSAAVSPSRRIPLPIRATRLAVREGRAPPPRGALDESTRSALHPLRLRYRRTPLIPQRSSGWSSARARKSYGSSD